MIIIHKENGLAIIGPRKAKTETISTASSSKTAVKTLCVKEFNQDSAKSFREEMAAACLTGQTFIPVVIDSYGGYVDSLLSMMDEIDACTLPVITIASGVAMSCGAMLLAYGDIRYAAPSASIMIHSVAGGAFGKLNDMELSVKQTKRRSKMINRRIEKKCKLSKGSIDSQLRSIKNGDWYMTAKQAKAQGFVDNVGIPSIEVNVETTYSIK